MRSWIRSNYEAALSYYVLSDLFARLRASAGDIDTTSGTVHSTLSAEDSVRYVERVFEDYKRYSGVQQFYGRVAEVGPGDNCGVALLFLKDGCSKVDLVDRFFSKRNVRSQATIYKALLLKYPALGRFLGHAEPVDEAVFRSLERHYGARAAAENFFLTNTGYDFIVSRAVFEHMYNPSSALSCMARALAPGGYLLHKIDLRDHGMFSLAHHELKFLEVPAWLYPWMTKGTGRPNRVMFHEYRDAMNRLGLSGQLLVTRLAGVGDISPHVPYEAIPAHLRAKSTAYVRAVRHRFATAFRTVSDDDISVTGVFLVARKD
ncbi:MAG: class I SAM-dependent methyltransferase [Sulfuritalea sp.]|nr:class I SAM-dependent methyltransferase [Sulfuritalea sp.]